MVVHSKLWRGITRDGSKDRSSRSFRAAVTIKLQKSNGEELYTASGDLPRFRMGQKG